MPVDPDNSGLDDGGDTAAGRPDELDLEEERALHDEIRSRRAAPEIDPATEAVLRRRLVDRADPHPARGEPSGS